MNFTGCRGGAYFLSMKMFYISLVSSVILIGCASTGTTNSNTGVTVTSVDEAQKADIGTLEPAVLIANNREYQLKLIPEELMGLNFLRMNIRENGDYTFTVSGRCKLYALVFLDPPVNPHLFGEELGAEGWEWKGKAIIIDELYSFLVYERTFDEGKYSMKSRGLWPYVIASRVPIKIADPD